MKLQLFPEGKLELNKFSQQVVRKDIRGKAGVYRLINNITGDHDVGSAIDLGRRLRSMGVKLILINQPTLLSFGERALRKYGLKSFHLEFLHFGSPSIKECRAIEQLAFYHFKPTYNILPYAETSESFCAAIADPIGPLQTFRKNHS